MNFIIVALIFLISVTMGPHCIFSDIIQDHLQSLALNEQEYEGTKSNSTPSIEALIQQNREKEVELERAQKVNRNFERMIQLVNILGQVDSFLSERTRLVLRKLALLAENDDGYNRRRRS